MNTTTFVGSDIRAYSQSVNALRAFFLMRGFVEVHTQDRLSILAACEDPSTVATYQYDGKVWPLPQTGQMWLEYELLTRPDVPGVFCVSTSYRQEPNPVPGRHKIIFPMFEFESRGSLNDLEVLEAALLEHLGYGRSTSFPRINYEDAARQYGVDDISSQVELKIAADYGRAVFLKNFPEKTSPFWNMRRDHLGRACKIDVILDGMETIGSAERSCDAEAMRKSFYAISNGGYAQKLFDLFGQERVEAELEDFLKLPFVPRYGGGIGMTRLMRSQSMFPVAQKIAVAA
jgi:aspartyl/asparaginyl-tRNA synthetase